MERSDQVDFTAVSYLGMRVCVCVRLGLSFLLLLLALFQERWRLELLFLLGWGLGGRALWSATLRFDWGSSGAGGCVISGQGLHAFLQFLRCLLLLLTSNLDGRRVSVCLLCSDRRERNQIRNIFLVTF